MNQVEENKIFLQPVIEGLYYIEKKFKTGSLIWHEGSNVNLINRGKYVIIKNPISGLSNYLLVNDFSKLILIK